MQGSSNQHQVWPITYPVISLLLQFVACCEENPAVCVCVCWDVKGRSLSMCCSKRVSASPGWAGLKSAAHWPEAACLHRTAGGAVTADCGSARGEETKAEIWSLSLSWALVTLGCIKSRSWIYNSSALVPVVAFSVCPSGSVPWQLGVSAVWCLTNVNFYLYYYSS